MSWALKVGYGWKNIKWCVTWDAYWLKEEKMSWKGTLRTLQVAQNRSERAARLRQNELKRQQSRLAKMQELERANYEVQVYENYLDVLLSIHKESGNHWDWKSIQASEPPVEPSKTYTFKLAAQAELDKYKPGVMDKLLNRVDSKREQLKIAVTKAKQTDEEMYQEALKDYEQQLTDWREITELAGRILQDEPKAHLEAIKLIDPFNEIERLGSSITFEFDGNIIEANLRVNGEEVIPSESKTLLKSGKLSVKKISKSLFYELYQDYVCSAVLRIARELFALLPIEMVLITATGSLLNTKTGHMEEKPILSVAIPKIELEKLNFDMIDPSDSMANFVHHMNFKQTKGFGEVESISPEELQRVIS